MTDLFLPLLLLLFRLFCRTRESFSWLVDGLRWPSRPAKRASSMADGECICVDTMRGPFTLDVILFEEAPHLFWPWSSMLRDKMAPQTKHSARSGCTMPHAGQVACRAPPVTPLLLSPLFPEGDRAAPPGAVQGLIS